MRAVRLGIVLLLAASSPSLAQDWTQIVPQGATPNPALGTNMVFDSTRGEAMLLGTGTPTETWTFDPATRVWTQKSPATSPPGAVGPMAYDGTRGRTVFFDRVTFTTWEWDGTDWSNTAPADPSMTHARAMAYDRARQRMVLSSDDPYGTIRTFE